MKNQNLIYLGLAGLAIWYFMKNKTTKSLNPRGPLPDSKGSDVTVQDNGVIVQDRALPNVDVAEQAAPESFNLSGLY